MCGTLLAALAAADALDAAHVLVEARRAETGDAWGTTGSSMGSIHTAAIRALALSTCPALLQLAQGQAAVQLLVQALEQIPLVVSAPACCCHGVAASVPPASPAPALLHCKPCMQDRIQIFVHSRLLAHFLCGLDSLLAMHTW